MAAHTLSAWSHKPLSNSERHAIHKCDTAARTPRETCAASRTERKSKGHLQTSRPLYTAITHIARLTAAPSSVRGPSSAPRRAACRSNCATASPATDFFSPESPSACKRPGGKANRTSLHKLEKEAQVLAHRAVAAASKTIATTARKGPGSNTVVAQTDICIVPDTAVGAAT
eukprot:CAMPEP_0175339780 /NCGR_PEP_ID=MMETSP0095-20121207/5507_1 /TAXON_ID=311494 /ORGANISM="Alexandrium monilatum, Strain CCMP3105" /LENGTH=171 /DNA_ID=CAMNT_0016637185 /DNA_START=83 /DNA_END=599 /DNA_ORIENTATION=+